MKGLQLLLVFTFSFIGSVSAAEKLDEATARTLIVRQLLSLVEGHTPVEPQTKTYQLCSYKDNDAYQQMVRHLGKVKVGPFQLKISNKTKRDQVASCNALYVSDPDQRELDWFLANDVADNTLFIVNGQKFAEKGFHIGLFLNNRDTFDFELNPEAFEKSGFTPRKELLQFGQVINSGLQKKVRLLRNLINFTDWTKSDQEFSKRQTFNLCTYKNKSLEAFINYFAQRKAFKSKTLQTQVIEQADQAEQCDTVIVNDLQDKAALNLIANRNQHQTLLIGNRMASGDQGVHYNLLADEAANRRFEINLIAFEQTGHSPHFELFNSAKLVSRDIPELARLLTTIVQQTQWPGESSNGSQVNEVAVCIYPDTNLSDRLGQFIGHAGGSKYMAGKSIELKALTNTENDKSCQAILLNNEIASSATDSAQLESLNSANILKLLINDKKIEDSEVHYQLVFTPKRISVDLNLDKLKAGGFIPTALLLEFINAGGDQ